MKARGGQEKKRKKKRKKKREEKTFCYGEGVRAIKKTLWGMCQEKKREVSTAINQSLWPVAKERNGAGTTSTTGKLTTRASTGVKKAQKKESRVG